jgi:hypothetical protein
MVFIRFLPSFCFLEQLALAGHVAAVALGRDVLAEGLDRLAGDDLAADRRLQRDFELVPVDLAAELDQEPPAAAIGGASGG